MLANKSSLTQEAILCYTSAVFCYTSAVFTEDTVMPAVMNVNEAKSNFSGLLSFVHNDRTVVTIMRYGHPIAQIVPCPPKRKLRKDPLLSKIKINCNLFEDESSDWESMND